MGDFVNGFHLHGARYEEVSLAVGAPRFVRNAASRLALHLLTPEPMRGSVALDDAVQGQGPLPTGWLTPTPVPEWMLHVQVRKGVGLERAGLLEGAAACFHRALACNESDTEALAGLARIALADGRAADAAELIGRALAVEPHHLPYSDLFLRCVVPSPRRIVERYEQRSWFRDGAPGHEITAAQAYLALGRPLRAREVTTGVLLSDELRGMITTACRAFEIAEGLFDEAAALALDLGNAEGIVERLTRALQAYPLHAGAALNLGLTHCALRRPDRALAVLSPLAARDCVLHPTLLQVNLAWAATATGQLALALDALEGAWTSFVLESDGHPEAQAAHLPCIARWDDAEKRIETSPREPLESIERLITACATFGLEVPRKVHALADLYRLALTPETSPADTPAASTDGEANDAQIDVDTPAVATSPWETGTTIGALFRVEQPLADGQRGPRCLATHRGTGARVVIERVSLATSLARRDVWNGLRIWCNLPAHEALVECRLFVTEGDSLLVVFDAPAGPSLDIALRQRESDADAARLITSFAMQLAWALEAAHANGVTHGPVPLSCVELRGESTFVVGGFWNGGIIGEEEAARQHIADLLAPGGNPLLRSLHASTLQSHLPIPRTADTPMGASRADWTPNGGSTVESDAWHWAAAVLEAARRAFALTPLDDPTPQACLAQIVASPHVGTLPSQLPPEISRILDRCLSDDVRQRPARMADIAEALQVVYGPHFQEAPPALVLAQQGTRALEQLTRAAASDDPDDAAADLPWKDPRLALAIAYHAAGLSPLAPRPFLPKRNATEQGRTLSHLAALEMASTLVESRLPSAPHLAAELARQRFEASMMLATLGDARGALRASESAVSRLSEAIDDEPETGLRFFMAAIRCEQAVYHEALGDLAAAHDAIREADRILRTTPAAFETRGIAANVSMRLAMVARRHAMATDLALDALQRGLKVWRDDENLEHLAYTQGFIAQLHTARGEHERAEEAWNRAIPLLSAPGMPREGPGPRLLANGWLQRAAQHIRSRRLDEAESASQQALDVLTQRVEKEGHLELSSLLATACFSAAKLHVVRKRPAEALALLRRARLTLERRVAQEGDATVLRLLVDGLVLEGQILSALEEHDSALAAARRARRWSEMLMRESPMQEDSVRGIAVERLLASCLTAAGQHPEAVAALQAARARLPEVRVPGEMHVLHRDLLVETARVMQRADLPQPAVDLATRVLSAPEWSELPVSDDTRADLLRLLGECQLALGRPDRAAAHAEEGLALASTSPKTADIHLRVRLHALLGAACMAQGLFARALQAVADGAQAVEAKAADASASATGARAAVFSMHVHHGRVALQIGDVAGAGQAFDRALRIRDDDSRTLFLRAICRMISQGGEAEAIQLPTLAGSRLNEAAAHLTAIRHKSPTLHSHRKPLLEALRCSAEASQIAAHAVAREPRPPFLARLRRRPLSEAQRCRANAVGLRLQAALLLGWDGCVRAWAADTLEAIAQGYDADPAAFADILVDATAALVSTADDAQREMADDAIAAARRRLRRLTDPVARKTLLARLRALR